jgi:hypothetical protein
VLAYAHPVAAGLTVALLVYVGSLGLRARNDRRHGAHLLARHARLAPLMYGLALATWAAGILSTWLLRRDLNVATSAHFRIGMTMVVALSAGAVSARWMNRAAVRTLHPWFGAAAILLAAAQVFFGLQLTP